MVNRLGCNLVIRASSCSFQDQLRKKASIEEKKAEEGGAAEENPKGIPEFWLTIFRSVDMLSDMLQVSQLAILFFLRSLGTIGQNGVHSLKFHERVC